MRALGFGDLKGEILELLIDPMALVARLVCIQEERFDLFNVLHDEESADQLNDIQIGVAICFLRFIRGIQRGIDVFGFLRLIILQLFSRFLEGLLQYLKF